MKRKILIITSSLTLAIAIALTITLNTHKNGLSDLALANVEALAEGEMGGGASRDSQISGNCTITLPDKSKIMGTWHDCVNGSSYCIQGCVEN